MRTINNTLVAKRVLEILDTHTDAKVLRKNEFGAWQVIYETSAQANIDLNTLVILAINAQDDGSVIPHNVIKNGAINKVDELTTNLVLEAFATNNKTIPGSPEYNNRRAKLCQDVGRAFQVAIEKIPYVLSLDSSKHMDPVVSMLDDALDQYNRNGITTYDDIIGCLSQLICAVTISRTSYWKGVDFFGESISEL